MSFNSLYYFEDAVFESRALREIATRRTQWDQMAQVATPELHAQIRQLSRTYPDLPSGVLTSAAQAGMTADSYQLTNLAEQYTVDQESGWNFMKTLTKPFAAQMDATRGLIRGVTTAFDMLWEEVIARPTRTIVGQYQGMTLPEAYEMAGQSIGSRAIDQWLKNPLGNTLDWMLPGEQVTPEERVNLGSGFFAQSDQVNIDSGQGDPRVAELMQQGMSYEDAIAEANRQYGRPVTQEFLSDVERIQISKGGKSTAVSPGRLLAISVFEPGTAGFNIMSGVADAAAQIYLDPADRLLRGVRFAQMARNTIVGDGARKTTTLKGAIFGKLSPTMNEFIDSDLGTDFVNWGVRTGRDKFLEIKSVLGRNVQGSGQMKWMKALADETDPDKWKAIFRRAYENPAENLYARVSPISMGLTRKARRGIFSQAAGRSIGGELGALGGVRVGLKNKLVGGNLYRMFSEMGGAFVPVGDLTGSVDEIEKFLSSAGFKADEMSDYLYRMAGADENNFEEILAVTRDAVNAFGDRLIAEGIPVPAVKYLTDVFNTQAELRKYWINAAGNPAAFNGSRVKIMDNGVEVVQPSAHLIAELINRAIPLPNPRQVRKALHGSKAKGAFNMVYRIEDSADLQQKAISRIMDGYMNKLWKPMTLIRVAWPIRVIGEEQLRMVGADLDSVFRHPMQYLGWAMSDNSRFGQIMGGIAKGEIDILGLEMSEAQAYQKAMSGPASFGLDPMRAAGPGEWVNANQGDPRYYVGLTREIAQIANDPLGYRVVQAGIDDIDNAVKYGDARSAMQSIKDRFWDGDLNQYRTRFIADGDRWDLLNNRRAADGYIDSIWARAADKTGGSYDYFIDPSGIWYNGLTDQPLTRKQIPQIGIDGSGDYKKLQDFANIDISTLGPENFETRNTKDLLLGYIDELNTLGDPMGEEVQILNELLGRVEAGATARENRRIMESAQLTVNGWLDDVPGAKRVELTAADRQYITGKEAEDLYELSGGADQTIKDRQVFGESVESITPMTKSEPVVMTNPTPDGVPTAIYGADPDKPVGLVMNHHTKPGEGVQTMSIRIEWSGDRVTGMHIDSAQMPESGGLKWSGARDLKAMGEAIEELGIVGSEDVLDMVMGGMPVRDWLLTSPALRVLDPDDVAVMGVGDMLKLITDDAGTSYGLNDVLEAVDLTPGSGIMSLGGITEHRKSVMLARALRQELGQEWTDFVDEFTSGVRPQPIMDDSLEDFFQDNPDLEGLIDRVRNLIDPSYSGAVPEDEYAARVIYNAVFAEATAEPAKYVANLRAQGIEPTDDIMAFFKGQVPIFPAPGNYPVTGQGARAMAGITNKMTQPKYTRKIPQDRPQYHITKSGNLDLLRAIATGELDGVNLRNISSAADAKNIGRILRDQYSDWAPAAVKVNKALDPTLTSMWDRAITIMFQEFMSKPTNQLSRSPAFRQFYWKRIARMMPELDEPARQEILRRASEAGISESFLKNELRNFLRKTVGRERVSATEIELERLAQAPIAGVIGGGMDLSTKGDLAPIGLNNLEAIDDVAKAFALEETKGLLYDISRKHDIADMTRNIFPFAEAWGEILSSWIKIFSQNPRMLRRLQQGVEGARGAGWFYEDPATGEEVFNYPGSGLLTNWMMGDNAGKQLLGGLAAGAIGGGLAAGIPGAIGGGLVGSGAAVAAGGFANSEAAGSSRVQFTGRVQGANLIAGSYLPGFGPIVQVGMANLMSEQMADPDWRWVRDLVLPFGAQEVDSPGEAIIDTALPAWFRKGLVSLAKGDGQNDRMYANTVMDVYKALLSGTGSDGTPQDAQITMDRAKKIAQNIYRIRSIAQFAAPTGPGVRFDIEDKTGQVWTYISLAQEWARMQRDNQFDEVTTFTQFTERFGLDPTLFSTAKTTSIVKRSTTEAGVDWQYANEELFDPSSPYYTTAYYARPDDPFAEYDYNAYLKQIKERTREGLTPEQWVTERNDFLGRIAYERARRMVGDRTDDAVRGWLRQTRYQLMDEYEGYNSPTIGVRKRAERDQLMRSFSRWNENSVLRNTEAGQGVVRYMEARRRALDQAAAIGISEGGFASAKSTAYLRNWLQEIGRYLATIYPDFGPVYDRVMRREVEDEEAQVALIGGTS